MHLVLPFASASSPTAAQAASTLAVPHLEAALARLNPGTLDEAPDDTLNTPQERLLARAWGWPPVDGLLPFAACAAQQDGVRQGERGVTGWGLLSPTHWHVGTDQVSLMDPASLALTPEDSRALFDTLATLFEEADGWTLHWGAPARWYATHPSLATLPTASLDRVVGRNVDHWLKRHPEARLLRRLQAEAQMLLHTHPVNERREAQGLLPVNSFWLSGTGTPHPVPEVPGLQVDDGLRAPALAEDWAAWAEAWAALDAGPVQALLRQAEAGQAVKLTLCGERTAQTFASGAPRPWWRRLVAPRRVAAAPVLAAL